ncbi:unnamed protein product, partial [Mesorhabditis spiculigera]
MSNGTKLLRCESLETGVNIFNFARNKPVTQITAKLVPLIHPLESQLGHHSGTVETPRSTASNFAITANDVTQLILQAANREFVIDGCVIII